MNDEEKSEKRLQFRFVVASLLGGAVFVVAGLIQMMVPLQRSERIVTTGVLLVQGLVWLWLAVTFNRRTWSTLRSWRETIELWNASNARMSKDLSTPKDTAPLTEEHTIEMSRGDIAVALMDWVHAKRLPHVSGKWHGTIAMSLDGTAKVVVGPGHLQDDAIHMSIAPAPTNRGSEKPN